MSDRIESGAPQAQDGLGMPPALRRGLLLGVFTLLIVAALFYGVVALDLLTRQSARMSGPVAPVAETLDHLANSIQTLVNDDHRVTTSGSGHELTMAERLRPLLADFRTARGAWLGFSETDLATDVLLSRHLNRKLAELDEQLGRLTAPQLRGPESQDEAYDAMQRAAIECQALVAQVRRTVRDAVRESHARELFEIHDATRNFVYIAAAALVGFIALSVAYFRQMRRYDHHVAALNELATLLSTQSRVPLFESMVGFLGRELGYAYVFIAQLNANDTNQVDTIAVFAHGTLAGNISYRLPGTPCENVTQRGVCFYRSGVQEAFPEDRLLQEMGVHSYAGTPLLDAHRQPVGILVLLDSRPIDPKDITSSLIQIIASRATTEIERMRAEKLRESALDGLEARVDARTADLRRTNAQLEEEVRARRDMERELEQARNLAEHGNRAKGEFLANASHEIRTNINGLLGMLSLIEDAQMEGEQLEYVEMAHASGDVLLTLINDLLDYSKIEAGQLQIEAADFDLDRLVGEIVDLFGVRARTAGLALETEVDIGLPRQLRGDVVRIRQVLSNLVDNALKFTDQGRVVLRVSAAGAAREGGGLQVRFEVEDTGIGFDPDKREQLFAPFAQADASITRRYGGTGLGLAISAQLVRMLGGDIDVDGAPGLGTRFWFTIPLQLQQDAGTGTGLVERDSLEGLRVLVVDDSAVSRAYLRSLLVAWHVDCEAVSSGSEAMERLRVAAEREPLPFEVVILDRLMPEMDGIELAERIGSNPLFGSPRLVMVTRYGGAVAADEAMRSGICGYLNKPVSQSQLFDTLVKAVGLRTRTHRPRSSSDMPLTGRILVVEDNLVNQRVAAGMLRKLGYQTDTVADGQQALAAVKRTRYDLVLMDCQMPVMDGYAAAEAIRVQESPGTRLPIVAMTAHALGGEREKCLEAGMDDYLAKPVRIADLQQKIDYWCGVVSATQHASPAEAEEAVDAVPTNPEVAPVAPFDGDAVDRAKLDELHEVMGDDLVALIDAYLQDTARRLDELDGAIDREPEVLVTVAHTLKGSSANIGARRFSERCSALHQRAKLDPADPELRELVGALASEFDQVRSALESYRIAL